MPGSRCPSPTEINRVFANLGKTLAAYRRTLLPKPARFDRYVASLDANGRPAGESLLSDDEIAGLRIFIGKGKCTNCHDGKRFTNDAFHNTAIPGAPDVPLQHRHRAHQGVQSDIFNCLVVRDSGAGGVHRVALYGHNRRHVAGRHEDAYAAQRRRNRAYMHTGQFATLAAVIEHYNSGGFALQGHNELPLNLTAQEATQLEAFLRTLTEIP